VTDLIIYDLIGWSHRNIYQFTGMNEHCTFTPINRPMKCSSGVLPAGIFVSGASSIRHQQFLPAGTGKSADLLAGGATATHLVSRIADDSHVMICTPVQRGVFVDVCTCSQVQRSSIWLQLTCMMAGKV